MKPNESYVYVTYRCDDLFVSNKGERKTKPSRCCYPVIVVLLKLLPLKTANNSAESMLLFTFSLISDFENFNTNDINHSVNRTMEESIRITLQMFDIDLKPSKARLVAYPDRPDKILYPGAHIATGVDGVGNHYHHGIVLDGQSEMKILHFWGPGDKTTARIQTTTLACFLAGSPDLISKVSRPLYLILYDNDDERMRRQTIERAEESLKKAEQYQYHLLNANCECLAAYCRTGKWGSEQVHKAIDAIFEMTAPAIKYFYHGTTKIMDPFRS